MKEDVLNFEKTNDNIVLSSPASKELSLNNEMLPSVETINKNCKETEES